MENQENTIYFQKIKNLATVFSDTIHFGPLLRQESVQRKIIQIVGIGVME